MSVYTGRGDKGQTDLFSGERVPKTDSRIESYGSVDELNSLLGMIISDLAKNHEEIREGLLNVQNKLHVICAYLANTNSDPDRPEITEGDVEELETRIDTMNDDLPNLTEFILPGGSRPGSLLHYARSVCRRAERRVIETKQENEVNQEIVQYLNRLSDYLFVAARAVNHRLGSEEINPSYD